MQPEKSYRTPCSGFGGRDRRSSSPGNLNGFNDPTPGMALYETRDGRETWTNVTASVIGGDGVGNSPAEQASSHTEILLTEDGGDSWQVVHESTRDGTWGCKFSFPTATVG